MQKLEDKGFLYLLAFSNKSGLPAAQAEGVKANQQLLELPQGSAERDAVAQRIQQLERDIELLRLEKSLFIIERRRRDDGDQNAVRRAFVDWEAKKLQPDAFLKAIEAAHFRWTPKTKQLAYETGGVNLQMLMKSLKPAPIDKCPVTAVYYIIDGAVFRAPGSPFAILASGYSA